ncbi:MAG: GYD domain-containing protein [Anaerolineae bacterium]
MTTFILLSKVSAEAVSQVSNLAEIDRLFDKELAELLPEVKRVASYALLGAYDFMHIFEAPDATAAAKVALLANRFGAGSTQTLTAIPFSEFKRLAQDMSKIQIAKA